MEKRRVIFNVCIFPLVPGSAKDKHRALVRLGAYPRFLGDLRYVCEIIPIKKPS
jgi:hypothetical protein